MSRMLGTLLALTLAAASTTLAQGGGGGGGGMGGGGMRQPPPDHWITADSLSKAVGGDAALAAKLAPHLAEVDKIMKDAVAERQKMMGGGGPPDPAMRQQMMTKMQGYQEQLDTHFKAIHDLLDAKQQAAFDALQKPTMMRRGGGRMGGGPPGQ